MCHALPRLCTRTAPGTADRPGGDGSWKPVPEEAYPWPRVAQTDTPPLESGVWEKQPGPKAAPRRFVNGIPPPTRNPRVR